MLNIVYNIVLTIEYGTYDNIRLNSEINSFLYYYSILQVSKTEYVNITETFIQLTEPRKN